MHLSTDGIIIKENIAGENDKYIIALTRERGLVNAYARGTRSLKNRSASATSLLCYSNLTFFKSRDTYKLNEASAIEMFFPLRSDIEKLSLAQYFCELSLCLAPEESEAEEFLRLVLNALHFLCKGTRENIFIKSIVELRMLSLAGYMPDLTCCGECGRDEDDIMYFGLEDGRIFCEEHKSAATRKVPLSRTSLAAMRHIIYSEFERLFSFSLPEQAARGVSAAAENFLLYQTERGFKTLDFYKSL